MANLEGAAGTDAARHVVISGTGRAGTTFLVQLLTCLGLDTGFDAETFEALPAAESARLGRQGFYPVARAGMEMDLFSADAPYIVKTPFLCERSEEDLSRGVHIEHAIIPVRRFEAAAASRAHVQKESTGKADGTESVPGGLWDTDAADNQADVLRRKFTTLVEKLVNLDIPMTFLMYPRLVNDPAYVHAKLGFLLKDMDLATFERAYRAVARPDWVHRFTADDQ